MTSDRMMQAIGRLERAISRLEAGFVRHAHHAGEQSRQIDSLSQRIREAETENAALQERQLLNADAPVFPDRDPHAMDAFSHDKALAALRSLDSLIDDLQKARRDG